MNLCGISWMGPIIRHLHWKFQLPSEHTEPLHAIFRAKRHKADQRGLRIHLIFHPVSCHTPFNVRLNELFVLVALTCAPACYRGAFQSTDSRNSLSLAILWRKEVLCLVIFQFSVFLGSHLPPGHKLLYSMRWNKRQKGTKESDHLLTTSYISYACSIRYILKVIYII